MQPPESDPRPITTGSVLREALAVFARRWWRYLVLYAVVLVPFAVAPEFVAWRWLGLALYLTFPLASGAIAFAVLNEAVVRAFGLTAYLGVGMRGSVLIVAGLVHELVVPLGLLFFVVPGLFLTAMWSVFIPALVAERGIGLGLSRSSKLTEGRRWVGFWVAALPFLLLLTLLIVDATTELHYVIDIALYLVIGLAVPPYGAVAAAVFYRRLVEQA